MTATPKQILTAARNLIAQPASWTRETLARNARGTPVEPETTEATCFCALGALARARYSVQQSLPPRPDPYWPLLHAHEHAKIALRNAGQAGFGINSFTISRVNDELGHEATLKMFDTAIAALPE